MAVPRSLKSPFSQTRVAALAALLGVVTAAGAEPAVEPAARSALGRGAEAWNLEVSLACVPEPGPGRVRCAAEAVSSADITWLDVLVVRAPDFAPPLRARVAANRGGAGSSAERMRVAVPLLARAGGEASLTVAVRAVLCPARSRAGCRSVTRGARALVSVRD